MPGRGRDGRPADAEAAGVLHPDGRRRHGGPNPAQLAGGGEGAALAISSSCCSTTRSTARSATRAASARCRTRRWPTVRRNPGCTRRSGYSPSRSPISTRDPAGPRTVRAVPALHPVLRPDRRRPVHRPTGTWVRAADRHQLGRAVPVVLLRQHHPDLPGRRATSAAYRFRSRPFDLVSTPTICEHCADGCAHAHRPPVRAASPGGWPASDPDSQRGVELRQGPVRLHLHRCRSTASPGRWSAARTGSTRSRILDRRDGGRRCRAGHRPGHRRGRGAHRRPADRHRRLRLRQVHPTCPAHQRYRLPGPGALRRGSRFPGRPGGRRDAGDRRGDLCLARAGSRGRAGRARAGGGVADPVPAAAQGVSSRRADLLGGSAAVAGAGEDGGHAAVRGARRRGRAAVALWPRPPPRRGSRCGRAQQGCCRGACVRRRRTGRGAGGRDPRPAHRRGRARRRHRGQTGLGAAPGR